MKQQVTTPKYQDQVSKGQKNQNTTYQSILKLGGRVGMVHIREGAVKGNVAPFLTEKNSRIARICRNISLFFPMLRWPISVKRKQFAEKIYQRIFFSQDAQ